jgi:ATP-binding cassette subfamily B protein
LLLYATNKIDIRVATKTFGHLLSLPNAFFEHISAGVLIKHMQQAARIREFLTGRLFLTMLDALSLFVFLPILALYSLKLTSLVLAFTALSGVVVALLMGPFRRRLYRLYQAESERQALLVETVHGMQTVKSLAMEPLQGRSWDDRCANSITTRFGVEQISAAAQSVTGFLEKLMTIGIIGVGAILVFSGEMTVGALVAFNMLAGRVSGPLVQMVTMVHEYQEVALAVQMLAEVMNQKPEREGKRDGLRPDLKGHIEFENISFRYGSEGPRALDDVSFSIPAGSVFGIVGKSGSGKTTLTRLISGLYPTQDGVLRIDGYDSRELDLTHLRKSLGLVLQDSFLFRGTVRDNIACVKRDASFAEVTRAAHNSGADEFIERLPRGYDTLLEENASNLSGGQRQRLAIARALIADPRILIFDEATSALDSESETIIRRNLRRIAEERTVIIVSHRLSMLADANSILVIDRGRMVSQGSHDQLLSRCTIYRHLWNQQMRQVA